MTIIYLLIILTVITFLILLIAELIDSNNKTNKDSKGQRNEIDVEIIDDSHLGAMYKVYFIKADKTKHYIKETRGGINAREEFIDEYGHGEIDKMK